MESSAVTKQFIPHWKPDCDGTTYFPGNHQLIHETTVAKVVRVFIAAGQAEPPHTHNLSSIMLVDQPTKIRVNLVDAAGQEKTVFERTEAQQNPQRLKVEHMEPEPYHYVTNIDTKDYLATRIEIKGEHSYNVEELTFDRSYIKRKIEPINQERYLISSVSSSLKIYRQSDRKFALPPAQNPFSTSEVKLFRNSGCLVELEEPFELFKPLDDLQGRPMVWCLSANQSYWIENKSHKKEYVQKLSIAVKV